MRNRNNGRKHNMPNRSSTFESNGPDVKIRGSAQQVLEKYLMLARDAHSSGDRVMSENYFQHAEHYYRVIMANGGGQEQRPHYGSMTPADRDEQPEDVVVAPHHQQMQPQMHQPAGHQQHQPQHHQQHQPHPQHQQMQPRPQPNGGNGANGNGAARHDGDARPNGGPGLPGETTRQ